MSERWQCLVCGTTMAGNWDTCYICKTPRGSQKGDIDVCPNCGKIISSLSNHCTNCKKTYRPFRKKVKDPYPRAQVPDPIKCFAIKQSGTLILASPDLKAERLYIMGPGDMLPIESEIDEYYCLHLPGNEKGYTNKKSGITVDLGIEEVKEPLGYVRQNFLKQNVNITILQPNGDAEIIGTLKADDHFPVVEEKEDFFKIQLPSGLQGWVHKADVIRTISATSVPEAPPASNGLADILLGVAGLMAIGLIGGLAGDPEENRVRRGVDKALRDRGM